MEPKFKVTQFVSKFMKVGDDYMTVEVPNELEFDFDGFMTFIGILAEGSAGPHTIRFAAIKEEAEK